MFDDQLSKIVEEMNGEVKGKIQELTNKNMIAKMHVFYTIKTHRQKDEMNEDGEFKHSSVNTVQNVEAVDFEAIVKKDMED